MTEFKIKPNSKKNKVLMWIIIANVVLWSTLAVLLVFNQDNAPSDPKYLAYTMAKKVISDKLKAPSTAKFQAYSDEMVTENNGTYQITMYVDSENSFGTMIRSKFILQIKYDGENYRLMHFKELPN